jgi:endonuclease/exonuclease/phosphatase (EEP) superfamily protein YafD
VTALASPAGLRRVVAIVVAAPWVVWALVRTLGLDGAYPLVPAMAFTPYVALTSPVPVVAGLLLRRWVVAAIAALALLAFALALVPRALAGGPTAGGPRLTVATANLYRGQADPRTLLRLARGADVLVLEELTPEELGRLDRAGLARVLPYRVAEPRGNASGTAIFARRPLRPLPSKDAADHAQPAARLAIPGAPPVLLVAVHPAPPVNGPRERDWADALAALPGPDAHGVRILAGDFNATLDHRALRRVLDRGYADAADRAGAGLHATWPALPRRALPIAIDHVLVDRRVQVDGVDVQRVPGSDHRALIARLVLPGQ